MVVTMRLNCPTNDVLDFGGYFLSLRRDRFFKEGVFQQPQAIARFENWPIPSRGSIKCNGDVTPIMVS
jgi:hypothetical protein